MIMASYEADQLESLIMRDSRLCNGIVASVTNTLARLMHIGEYDDNKAVSAFRHIADEAARRYGIEVYGKDSIPPEFTPEVRDELAVGMMYNFIIGFENGDFDGSK